MGWIPRLGQSSDGDICGAIMPFLFPEDTRLGTGWLHASTADDKC